ncbi:MAG: hypothetical protein KGI11_09105 [Thaumarchaeota archaeon]|nr:hypothetical protein [Nitrososphaerota archaeon]
MQNTIHTFKPGDKVVVVERTPRREGEDNDWKNGWVTEMEAVVGSGRIFTVRSVKETGVYFFETWYGWDWKSLAFAEGYVAPPPPSKHDLVCQKIKTMYQRRAAQGYKF